MCYIHFQFGEADRGSRKKVKEKLLSMESGGSENSIGPAQFQFHSPLERAV